MTRPFVPTGEIGHRDMPSTGGRSAYREARRLASELVQRTIERDEARDLAKALIAYCVALEGPGSAAVADAWNKLPAWVRVIIKERRR